MLKMKALLMQFLTVGVATITLTGAVEASELSLPIEQQALGNGIQVITLVDHTMPTVSFQVFVNAGSRDEVLPGKTGLAHIFEHLMFRGTKRYPSYDDALITTGAENNADTSDDRTRYFESAKAEFLDKIMEVEADRFRGLNFDRTAFNNELGPVRQEREKGTDNNPHGFLMEKLHDLAYTVHTYKHDTIGTKDDIIKMQYEDAYNFYNTFYQPRHIFIVIAGDFDRAKALARLETLFGGDWGRKAYEGYATPPAAEPPQEASRRGLEIWKDAVTPPLLFQGYHIPAFSLRDSNFCALELTENLLFLDSSPLNVELSQKLRLVQPGGIGGGARRGKDPALFYFMATLRQGAQPKDLSAVERSIEAALKRLASKPVGAKELEKARNNYIANTLYGLDRAGDVASSIGELYVLTQDAQTLNKLIDCYRGVTPKDIQRVVSTYLVPKNRSTMTLLPKTEKRDGAAKEAK